MPCTFVREKPTGSGYVRVPVRSSSNSSTRCLLHTGDRNVAVKALQNSINKCYPVEVFGMRLAEGRMPTQLAVDGGWP